MATTQQLPPPPPPKWVLDLNTPATPKPKNTSSIPDPPGFPTTTTNLTKKGGNDKSTALSKPKKGPTNEEMDTLKMKKAWEVAIQPAKNLPMSAIGMYMSGNSLQIFTIFMLFQVFKTPISGLMGIQQQFARFESEGTRQQLILVKVAYVACQMLGVALGVWKINKMGLLPTTTSDWLAWETQRMPLERAVPDFPF